MPGGVVTSAAYRHREVVLAGELERANDVDDARAARAQRRPLVDRAVSHLAGAFVGLVRGEHEPPSERGQSGRRVE
jgi:hypothetical protein